MDNLALLAIFIMFLWLATIGYYLYTSRQQKEIAQELDDLREMLGDENEQAQE